MKVVKEESRYGIMMASNTARLVFRLLLGLLLQKAHTFQVNDLKKNGKGKGIQQEQEHSWQ